MYAMLTLDLNENVSVDERVEFNRCLGEKGWIKIDDVTTTWSTQVPNDWYSKARYKSLDEYAKKSVKEAAKEAASESRILPYNAVVQVGQSEPTPFSNE